jgi:hypothetical protein
MDKQTKAYLDSLIWQLNFQLKSNQIKSNKKNEMKSNNHGVI